MQNQPAANPNPQIETGKAEPKQKSNGLQAMTVMGAFALAVGACNLAFLTAVDMRQDADPVFVIPVAEQAVEDMGYNNVRITSFNKYAEDKPARLTFSAEKDFSVYIGEADCTARSCRRVEVSKVSLGS